MQHFFFLNDTCGECDVQTVVATTTGKARMHVFSLLKSVYGDHYIRLGDLAFDMINERAEGPNPVTKHELLQLKDSWLADLDALARGEPLSTWF